MNYFICIISDHVDERGIRTRGLDIFQKLMAKEAWGLHPSTAARAKLTPGSAIVFYLGGKHQTFLGTARTKGEAYLDKSGASDGWYLEPGTYRVDLQDITIWDRPKPIKPLLKKLSFIKNILSWGAYLQGGVRRIDEDDYRLICDSQDYSATVETEQETVQQFLAHVDLAEYDVQPHSLPAPERIKVADIVDNIEQRWKIPNFQRYFDWKKEDVRSFLESIFKDYYVGAFLLWKADVVSPLDLIPIEGVTGPMQDTEYIILDGQQRMTALYYAVKSPDILLKHTTRKCYFYVDFKKICNRTDHENIIISTDEMIDELTCFERLLFPIYEIEQYDEWINRFEDYLYENEPDIPHATVRTLRRLMEKRLKHVWRGFEIPYVVLPKTIQLPQVAEIFEKINSTGKQLSTFDLLIARLLKYDVQLRTLWDEVSKHSPQIQRYTEKSGKIQLYIFQTMSLQYHPASSAKKQDILNIFENLSISTSAEFEEIWNEAIVSMEHAIDMLENLRDGFGVKDRANIPFLSVIPVLAALLTVAKKKSNKAACFAKVKQWYWSSVFTNAYSSGVDSQMSADFVDVSLWFDDDEQIPRVVREARKTVPGLDLQAVAASGNAIYKGVLSLLALRGSKDFETDLTLEFSPSNDKDHIFPKAPSAGFAGYKGVESVVNMTWLSKETNNRKRAKRPSVYIPEFIHERYADDSQRFQEVAATHLIDRTAYHYLLEDSAESFMAAREKNIKRHIQSCIGIPAGVEEIIDDSPSDAVDILETALRHYTDRKLADVFGPAYWDQAVTTGIKHKVTDKLNQHRQKYPSPNNGAVTGLERFSFCDIMDYAEIITSKWDIFEADFRSKREVEKHFLHLKDYRNAIKHNRPMNNIERKQGEASFEWLYTIVQRAV